MSKIVFATEDTNFLCKNKSKIREWIKATIHSEGKRVGEVSIIFTSDKYLQDINIKYLNHSTLTDIVTFNYNEKDIISGDLFISVERVKENADSFKQLLFDELKRVIIHGALHLLGYNDKSENEKKEMTKTEDKYLHIFPS